MNTLQKTTSASETRLAILLTPPPMPLIDRLCCLTVALVIGTGIAIGALTMGGAL